MKIFLLLIFFVGGEMLARSYDEYPLTSPELSGIMRDMTMYISYNSESLEADSFIGDKALLKIHKSSSGAVFEEGVSGKALILPSASGFYSVEKNVTVKNSGSAVFWVKVLESKKESRNSLFLRLNSNDLFLLRQGGGKTKNPHLIFIARNIGDKRASKHILMPDYLKDKQWHMLAVNWKWPTFSMSVDGNIFSSRTLSQTKTFKEKLSINIGANGGPKTLMDEVLFFSRPLSNQEVKKLYRRMKPQKPESDNSQERKMK